jgi:hypothetical protein
MPIIKSTPIDKVIKGNLVRTSDLVVSSDPFYDTNGENFLILRDIESCKIKLNSSTTDHITIKALTRVLIIPDINKIDEEYDEIMIDKGACVEFYFGFGSWYIVSSDGLKGS